ncbi:MAG: FMN-binding protein [Microbacteriaceae bacterium]|nr:FMN-binding protein [Microbacteriaceae bacterium]
MRTRTALGGVFASLVVMIVGWQAGAVATAPKISTASGSSAAGSTGAAGSSNNAAATYTGDTVSTRFGDVQVQVTVSGGSLTDVVAVKLTDHDGRSVQISNRAEPVLRSEVIAAQSAAVDTVSGATYTSDAYLGSLQSALDQAGL